MEKPQQTPSGDVDSPQNEKNIKAEFKRNAFDRELKSLIKQSHETINARYGMSMEFGNVRPESICLNRYSRIYNSMDPVEHFQYFETLYNRKRLEILNCLKDDRWIRTGNIVIQFGEGIKSTKEIEEQRRLVKIMISDIFLIACDLQAKAEQTIDGIDEKFIQDMDTRDIIRPNIILLHLIRIFYHLNDGVDKEQLGHIVSHLEDDLGVTNKTVGSEPWKNIDKIKDTSNQQQTGAFTGLFTMATNMMEKMGFKPPPEMKPPSENEISTVMNSVFNNEATQNAIQGMFSSLQGCNDFGTAIQEVVKNVTDQKTMEAIQSSVIQTANIASKNSDAPLEQNK